MNKGWKNEENRRKEEKKEKTRQKNKLITYMKIRTSRERWVPD
jgi:hypothetical protein